MAMPSASWVERFYTHFVARDMTCIFAGSILVISIEYALFDRVWITNQEMVVPVFGFLIASYFIGMGMLVLAARSHLMKAGKLDDWYQERSFIYSRIGKKYGTSAVLDIERNAFLATAFYALTVATLVSSVLVCVIWTLRWFLPWLVDATDVSIPIIAQLSGVRRVEHVELLIPLFLIATWFGSLRCWRWFRDEFSKRWTKAIKGIDGGQELETGTEPT